ncbi:MAG: response regulator [Rhodospirillaceae bacterium]
MGHAVDAVEDGLAALNRVTAADYDVVIMDMQMPVMDGEEATAAIRALPRPKGAVPVLALTADVMPEHRERYPAAGVNGLVPKPIDWPSFAAALDACADGRSPEAGR